MLEHIPRWLGAMMRNIRAGHARLVIVNPDLDLAAPTIDLASPAFGNGARLPVRFTADGEGVSPPLVWNNVPAGTASLALIVEDPDAPAPHPFVHAIVCDIQPGDGSLAEGAIMPGGDGGAGAADVGRNSYLAEGWLPPDPPTGHGTHDYVFQIFALSDRPDLGDNPGRSGLVKAMAGKVLAAGMLVGTYSRGEPADIVGSATGTIEPARA